MTKVGGANYAGFRSDSHICECTCIEAFKRRAGLAIDRQLQVIFVI